MHREWLLDVEDPGPGGSSDETWPRPRSMYSMVYDTKSKVRLNGGSAIALSIISSFFPSTASWLDHLVYSMVNV